MSLAQQIEKNSEDGVGTIIDKIGDLMPNNPTPRYTPTRLGTFVSPRCWSVTARHTMAYKV